MLISIIIPTYKPGDYIFECLDSIRQQTFSLNKYEIIIVLNGCCEPYKSKLSAYIKEYLIDFNVVFIQLDEGGVSNARNVALQNARGKYITFIDDDDFISPKYLELLYEKSSCDTIALCYPYAFADGDLTNQLDYRIAKEYKRRSMFNKQVFYKAKKYFSGPWMKLISMDIILERKFDTRFANGEDSIFNFLISDRIKYVDFTSKEAVYYRRYREGSAVTSKRNLCKRCINSVNMIKAYTDIVLKNPMRYNWWFYVTRILGAIRSIVQI